MLMYTIMHTKAILVVLRQNKIFLLDTKWLDVLESRGPNSRMAREGIRTTASAINPKAWESLFCQRSRGGVSTLKPCLSMVGGAKLKRRLLNR